MRLHRYTSGLGVHSERYCHYARCVITTLHSVVHGVHRVQSTSTRSSLCIVFFFTESHSSLYASLFFRIYIQILARMYGTVLCWT